MKLVRKADSFTSEGALFRQGDRFRIARNLPRIGGRRDDRFLQADLSLLIRSVPTHRIRFFELGLTGAKAKTPFCDTGFIADLMMLQWGRLSPGLLGQIIETSTSLTVGRLCLDSNAVSTQEIKVAAELRAENRIRIEFGISSRRPPGWLHLAPPVF